MSRLANALNAVAEHAKHHADITYEVGHEPSSEEMAERLTAVDLVSADTVALANQARDRHVQRSEVELLTARFAKLNVALPMDLYLALIDALAEE